MLERIASIHKEKEKSYVNKPENAGAITWGFVLPLYLSFTLEAGPVTCSIEERCFGALNKPDDATDRLVDCFDVHWIQLIFFKINK